MMTLALDTTGTWCTVALVDTMHILAHNSENIGRGHAERLAPMVQETLQTAAIKPDHIERLSICTGPGSFTGLRVALAFGRSFALPLRRPVIGISALEAQAMEIDPMQKYRVLSIINVKRGELCWALYDQGRIISGPVTEPVNIVNQQIKDLSFDKIVGDGAGLIGLSTHIDHVNGPILAWLAMDRSSTTHPPDPFYSRGPDAKLPKTSMKTRI